MKVGDVVKLKVFRRNLKAGVVTDFIDRKCWRTEIHGKKVDWAKISPEQHAVVMFDDGVMRFPVVDLEVIDEAQS